MIPPWLFLGKNNLLISSLVLVARVTLNTLLGIQRGRGEGGKIDVKIRTQELINGFV